MTHTAIPVASLLLAIIVAPLLAQQGDKDAKKWDVASAALGPTHSISFETNEATWVNVDVSPDGRTVILTSSATSTRCQSKAPAAGLRRG